MILLNATDVAAELRCSRRHVERLNVAGQIPSPIKVGHAIRWRAEELSAWVAAGCPDRTRWESQDESHERHSYYFHRRFFLAFGFLCGRPIGPALSRCPTRVSILLMNRSDPKTRLLNVFLRIVPMVCLAAKLLWRWGER